jgi:hypothetical protein
MRPIFLTKQLTAAAANNIALAQTTAGAADLVINGSLASGGVATLDTQRRVAIASTGNFAAVTFTVYGTDQQGNTISDAILGPNNGTVSTTKDFATVTRVSTSAIVGTNVTVGTSAVGATPGVILDQYISPFNIGLAITVGSGLTVNGTVQYTFDDVFASGFTWGGANWTSHASLTSKAVNTDSNIAFPCSAVRLW